MAGGMILFLEMSTMGKKDHLFNPAFEKLGSIVEVFQKDFQDPDSRDPEGNTPIPDDAHYFKEAMSGVLPLPGHRRKAARSPGTDIRPAHPAPDDEQEGIAQLNKLVNGSLEMDITFSDEYIEGSVPGLSPRIMRRLKRGQFSVQDHLDLHGLTKQEAEVRVRAFLAQSHKLGLRCVLIVHGRGLNSPDSFPVLKDRLPVWLNRGFARKTVLAFATARPYDGGTGAIYVLLRRR